MQVERQPEMFGEDEYLAYWLRDRKASFKFAERIDEVAGCFLA